MKRRASLTHACLCSASPSLQAIVNNVSNVTLGYQYYAGIPFIDHNTVLVATTDAGVPVSSLGQHKELPCTASHLFEPLPLVFATVLLQSDPQQASFCTARCRPSM